MEITILVTKSLLCAKHCTLCAFFVLISNPREILLSSMLCWQGNKKIRDNMEPVISGR